MIIKVLIIDDSSLVRQTLPQVLETDPEICVIATATDPIVAVHMLQNERPDVIISDIEMARMDGLTFLRKMNETIDPIPIVICSSLVKNNSPEELKAYDLGACEVILKPSFQTKQFLEESRIRLCDAVKSAYSCTGKIKQLIPSQAVAHSSELKNSSVQKKEGSNLAQNDIQRRIIEPKYTADVIMKKPDAQIANSLGLSEPVVVVGASTGGTEALKDFLGALPEDCPGMVVVQHMPEHFTQAFAERLDRLSKVTVKEASNGDVVKTGTVLIAPGNSHLLLKREGNSYFVEIKNGPLVTRHRPSVDVLFRSAARYAGKNAIGVIMTGMGDDGSHGMKEMHDAGAYNIAQDEKTSIVWGMPGEAVKAGAVDKVLPLDKIAEEVCTKAKIMQMNFNHIKTCY